MASITAALTLFRQVPVARGVVSFSVLSAFDAVGPLLLIGWAEVGPGLLQAITTISRKLSDVIGSEPLAPAQSARRRTYT